MFSLHAGYHRSLRNETKTSHPKAPEQGSPQCSLLELKLRVCIEGPAFLFNLWCDCRAGGENITSSHLSNLASKTVSTSWRTDGMYFKAATWVEHEINMSDIHIPHLCAVEWDTWWHEADQRMTLHPGLFNNHARHQGLCTPLCTQENSQARKTAHPVNKLLHTYKEPSSGPQHPCQRLSSTLALRTWKAGDARTSMSNLPVSSHWDPLF